jgi:L-ascorbate metabolism protein UlaG (beta-lactamase superfamily)
MKMPAVVGHANRFGALALLAGIAAGSIAIRAASIQGGTADRLKAGEARIWYLGHCGFAVRTAGQLLIFDYQQRRDGQEPRVRPDKRGLDTGWIDPAEIRNDRVRVFVSHSHDDHFDPVVFTWRPAIPDIKYFFGWKAADDPAYNYLVGPRATYSADGLEIFTINSHHSGVPEVAFLVKVDGLAIYHNGDYQMDYRADFPYLQTHARTIDLMFVPPVAREDLAYAIQNKDLFDRFRPKGVFPMHAAAGAQMYREFADAFRQRAPGVPIMIPERLGDRFNYAAGRISRSGR